MSFKGSKNENPEINSTEGKKRGRPAGRKNSSIREDRKEACRAVAMALIKDPTVTVVKLAERAFPATDRSDEKGRKRTHERTRQALATLEQILAQTDGDGRLAEVLGLDAGQAAEVREALAKRREHKEWRRRVRERARKEREERSHLTPARIFLQRLLRFPEVREEFALVMRERRQQVQRELAELAAAREAGMDEIQYQRRLDYLLEKVQTLYAFAFAPDLVVDAVKIKHFSVRYGSSITTMEEALRKAAIELRLQRQSTNLATVPYDLGKEILRVLKALQRAYKKGDTEEAELLKEEFRDAVRRAVDEIAWADPELPACQLLETGEARNVREKAMLHEVIKFYPKLPTLLTRDDTEDWPEPWSGPSLQMPEDWERRPKLIPVGRDVGDLDGGDDEAAEVAREAAGMTTSDTLTIGAGRVKNGGSRTDITTAYNMLS